MIVNSENPDSLPCVKSIVIGGGYHLSPQSHVEDQDLRFQYVLWRQK